MYVIDSVDYSTCTEPECCKRDLRSWDWSRFNNAETSTYTKHSISIPCITANEYDFIEHYVNLGMDSPLQELKCIIDQPSSNDHWIRLIPRLMQLKSLELLFHHDLALKHYIDIAELSELILNIAHGCSSLEKITLHFGCLHPVPRLEWILPLSNHPHLKHFVAGADSCRKDMFTYPRSFQHVDKVHVKLATCDIDYMADMAGGIHNLVYTEKENR